MKKYFISMIIMTMAFSIYTPSSSAGRALQMVAFGDSITHGTGDPMKKGYVGRVKERLETVAPTVRMKNYGVPKFTSNDILKLLQQRKILRRVHQANYIILYIGTNDFRQSAQHVFNPLPKENLAKGKELFLVRFNQIITLLRQHNRHAPIIVLGLYHPYIEYENETEIFETIEGWNQSLRKVAQAFQQAYFVPTADLFLNDEEKQLFSDSLHLNAQGYELLSKRVFKKIISLEEN
ncbi:GDSL-type esterase/lipase family protein [Robertmurraya sp. DFI.2.37]|nr:GDSL-type esterase/lipase family protein [Robertmurraya sp. DFI.2.37]MDF1507089.1 GDSL-type esterase/lipase family protein [Robertmurraya sp. DFI.2.37]